MPAATGASLLARAGRWTGGLALAAGRVCCERSLCVDLGVIDCCGRFVPLRPRWPAGGHPVTRGDSPLRRIPSPLPSRTRDRRKADQAVPIPDSERNLRKNSTFFARAR